MNIIEFPGLWGLKLDINPIAFHVGKFNVYWYGIIIAVGMLIAVLLAMKHSEKYGIPQERMIDLVLFAAPVAIIFARLYFVIFKWSDFNGDIRKIVNIRQGGLAIYGGVIGAFLVAYFFARYNKIGVLKLLDFGVPYLVLAQAIGRWGNFVNQEAYGVNTTLPWGMTSQKISNDLVNLQAQGMSVFPDLPVHPTFLYESLWDLCIFFFLIWFRKRRKVQGEVFFLYMVLYGVGRAFIEGLRTDSLMLGNVRISQLLSILFAVTFAVLFYVRRKKNSEGIIENSTLAETSEYGEVLKQLSEDEGEVETPASEDESAKTADTEENVMDSLEDRADSINEDTESQDETEGNNEANIIGTEKSEDEEDNKA
jgi:phosphatidylglycerol---prolipoprotein diacylglyceryl transferase